MVARFACAARSFSMFHLRSADVATTGTPSAAESDAVSTASRDSSLMFRQSVNATPCSASWIDSNRARRRLPMSPTWTTCASGHCRSRSRVTRSSFDCGARLFVPGVSMTSRSSPCSSALAVVISTVVPG